MVAVKNIVKLFFKLFKYTGHIDLNYNSTTNTVSLLRPGFHYYRFKINLVFYLFLICYYVFQTWRCFHVYKDRRMCFVVMCWVIGVSIGFFGSILNSVAKKNERLFTFNQLLKYQKSFFGKL